MSDGWAILSALATLAGAAVAVAGAIVSWISSARAKRERQGAEEAKAEALELNRKMVAALESTAESQRVIAEQAEAAPRTPRWSAARNINGQLFGVQNLGPDDVTVLAVSASPEGAGEMVRVRSAVPGIIKTGAQLRFLAFGRWGLSVESLTITWSAGDGEPEETVIPID